MNNREYWQIRALLQEQAAKEKGSKFLKDLAKMYNISLKEIQKDIEKWFKRYAKEEGIALEEAKRLLTAKETIGYQLAMEQVIDEAENEYFQKYLRHKYMSERITRLDSLKNQVSVQLELLAESKDVQTFEYLKSTYKDNVFLNKSNINIESTFHKFSETAIEETVLKPWSGKSFSDRIWTDTTKLIDEVQEVLSVGLIQGHDIDKMSKKIARRMEVSQNRAKTLVRTETNYILSQATFDTYENFEVEQYEFLATLDYKTSEICQSLDKKLFFVKDRQVGLNCNPMHPNCRSTTIPYFEDGVEGMRIAKGADGKSYHIKDSISYKEWYNSLSTEERKQLEVLKKKEMNRTSDGLQYGRYKKIIGKDNIPKAFDEFQNLKYNDSEKWKLIVADYKRKNRLIKNPETILPNVEKVTIDDRKFTHYLFGGAIAKGLEKGKLITEKLGYGIDNFDRFKQEILEKASQYPVSLKKEDRFGKRYEQRIFLYNNNQEPINLEVGWLVDGDKTHLTSIYITEVKRWK